MKKMTLLGQTPGMNENEQHSATSTLVINEIFHSIQGESGHMGRPCVFVRLTYCNLRCDYCDSEYAFYDGREYAIDEILGTVHSYSCPLVEITGGEPLMQPNVHPLMRRLCDEGFEVLLETGGSLDVGDVDPRVHRIVDFKCPSSGMVKKNLWSNISLLGRSDEVKFVIGDRGDYDWAKKMMVMYEIPERCSVLMSVVFGKLEPQLLAGWILQDRLGVRFQLQMHKYIWHPATRGV